MCAIGNTSVMGSLLLSSLLTYSHLLPVTHKHEVSPRPDQDRTFPHDPAGLARTRLADLGQHRRSPSSSARLPSTAGDRRSSGAPAALSWLEPRSSGVQMDSVTDMAGILFPSPNNVRGDDRAVDPECDEFWTQAGKRRDHDATAAMGSVSRHSPEGDKGALSVQLFGSYGKGGPRRNTRRPSLHWGPGREVTDVPMRQDHRNNGDGAFVAGGARDPRDGTVAGDDAGHLSSSVGVDGPEGHSARADRGRYHVLDDARTQKEDADTRSAHNVDGPRTNSTKAEEESDPGAVMYIIVVLVFYSTGVMVMIVRYLRTEKKELEEEVTLENFFKNMPDKRVEKEYRVNRMAIHAFHTLTSISYDDDQLEGLDLGSDTETDSRNRKPSDATSSQPLLANDL
ncbi:uncharacterized protein LOC143280485 [Babylonia areolata]|uniref:uncharacterized protein LOC143280485 n=1 Tax=Babylonia areolata TaxID=304850 RepID=UPI003FCF9AA2